RFLREIETAARLNHPQILPLHDSGAAEGLLYYVMPYVEGESLRERLRREKQLPLDDALRITREVADALDYAHSQGVVHRDIKPENILISRGHAVVADFGIARAIRAAGGAKLTETGLTLGTPLYMSPEQAIGGGELDGRSDQYSLACVLYEMLAGEPPFTGPTGESLVHQHLSVEPRRVTELRPATPPEVAHALNRALAKTPADRFSTPAQFASALMVAGPAATPVQTTDPPASAPPALPAARRRRWAALAVTVAVAVALAVVALRQPIARLFHGRDSATAGAIRDWILVSEFDGPVDDPTLAAGARELVSTGLDQSSIVATVPRSQLKEALRLAGKPDTTRVSGEVALELAVRGRVRTVVEGRIERIGKSYSIVTRVLNAEDGHALLTVSEVARNEAAVIPSVGRLTRRLRDGLGENRSAIRGSRDIWQVATPSFEAFRYLLRASELQNDEGDDRGALGVASKALALDPDFAMAWLLKGFEYNHLGAYDSSDAAIEEALRRPNRLSEMYRLLTEGQMAMIRGDLATAEAREAEAARRYPNNPAGLGNRGAILALAGHYEEALDCEERAVKIGPYWPPQWILINQFQYFVLLGRLDEARGVARNLRGWNTKDAALGLEMAAEHWARADSLATAFASDATVAPEVRIASLTAIASNRAASGALASAGDALRQARELADGADRPDLAQAALRAQVLLAMVSGGSLAAPRQTFDRDTTTTALITRGLWASVNGDTRAVQGLLQRIESRPAHELSRHGAGPTLLGAWVMGRAGDWEGAVRVLGPAARQGAELGYVTDPIGRVPLRWLVADAYERLGKPDSAAAYFELALSPARTFWEERVAMRMASSFAHRRLVMLYAHMGRLTDAERHWQILAETFTHPDPELRDLVDDARSALVSARGISQSKRR
ncbi:MAG: protein kinase, partial [Candidatus Eisenbacteria bacterium]|nr:protein kinase [Candidatus Eisenbacteria bacterium]